MVQVMLRQTVSTFIFLLLSSGVVGNSTFFDVPLIPYLIAAGENNSVIIAQCYINTVPNLVDISSTPAKQLTNFNGKEHSGLQMSAPLASKNGRFVFAALSYSDANPSLLAELPAQREIVAVAVDGLSPPIVIASSDEYLSTGCALSSPNSSSILYIKGSHSVYLYDGDTGETSLQLEVSGGISDLECSLADASTVAFTVQRGSSHSYVATYTLGDDRYQSISASADFDDQPALSPSGTRLAWRRRRYQYTCDNVIDRVDYQILMTDLSNGGGNVMELFRGDWFTFYYYGFMPVRFLDESTVIFPHASSDPEGWVHVALWTDVDSVDIGGQVVDIQQGMQCDTFSYLVIDSGLLFTHNCDVLESRSLSFYNKSLTEIVTIFDGSFSLEYGVAGSHGLTFLVLSSAEDGDGQEQGSDRVACLRSSFNHSEVLLVALSAPADMLVTIPGPVLPMAAAFVPPLLVSFPPSDDPSGDVSGLLYLPLGPPPEGGYKAVIWTHGGPHTITSVGLTADTYYAFMVGFHSYLASEHNIATLAINYRCSIGYGTTYMGVPNTCADNAEQFDVVGGANFLMTHPLINSEDGLGIHGLSYGAWNAYTALAFHSDLFSVGVGVSGVSNRGSQQPFVADSDAKAGGRNMLAHPLLSSGDKIKYGPFPDINFPGWSQRASDNMDYLFAKSPIASLENWTSPTLIIGCGDDDVVPVEQAIALYHQLQAVGTDAEFHLFPETVHAGNTKDSFQGIGKLTADFLVKHLTGGAELAARKTTRGMTKTVQVEVEEGVYPFCSLKTATDTSDETQSLGDSGCDCSNSVPVWAMGWIAASSIVAVAALLLCVFMKTQYEAMRRDVDHLLQCGSRVDVEKTGSPPLLLPSRLSSDA
jgi:hypothetical protein